MNRPLAVDMTRIRYLVSKGIIKDRLEAIVQRFSGAPVDEPQWLIERGYAYGQVRCFSLAVFKAEFVGETAQDRILQAAQMLLSEQCEWIVDADRLADVRCEIEQARTVATVLTKQWQAEAPDIWAISADLFGGPVRYKTQGQGAKGSTGIIHCKAPEAVLDHAFGKTPHLGYLVQEGGNRKYNVRFGLHEIEEIHLASSPPPISMLRIFAETPQSLLPPS